MKKVLFLLCFIALIFVVGCGNNSDTNEHDGSDSSDNAGSTEAGIHLGIIGFHKNLDQTKNITRLINSGEFIDFIDGLHRENYTALYLAADKALEMMQQYNKPAKLEHVALVTFTDGIDNQSIAGQSYNTKEEYLEVVHNKIFNEQIHDLPVEAYSIGFNSETDMSEDDKNYFDKQLKQLASTGNDFQSSNMQEVKKRFAEIAANLSKVSKTVDMGLYMAGGYNDGFVIRYTFDNVDKNTVKNSKLYIEGTYRKQAGTLENISYQGFKTGASSVQAQKTSDGILYFMFQDLRYSNGDNVPDDLYRSANLWYKRDANSDWVGEVELDMGDMDPIVNVDQSSALIMLVLDCTTSLSDENFKMMQDAAKEFVWALNGSSSYNGGGSGDNSGNYDPTYDDSEDNSDGCAENNLGKQCTTDTDCGACMICISGGKCAKGCTSDSDCSLTGTHCNIKLARCLNIYASNSACSEANCPTGCCYAEKGLTGLRCAPSASPATCGLCNQNAVYSPSDSKCLATACSSTTDDCPSINSGATNPPAKCYSCKAGELVCKANTATSGCSAGFIVNMNECIPSGRQCIEGVSECCSGMPCIQGFCY